MELPIYKRDYNKLFLYSDFLDFIASLRSSTATKEDIKKAIDDFVGYGLDFDYKMGMPGSQRTILQSTIQSFRGREDQEDILLYLCDKLKEAAGANPAILENINRSYEIKEAIIVGLRRVIDKMVDMGVLVDQRIFSEMWSYVGGKTETIRVLNLIIESQSKIKYSVYEDAPRDTGGPINVGGFLNSQYSLAELIRDMDDCGPCCFGLCLFLC
jgi:hypothetical protein